MKKLLMIMLLFATFAFTKANAQAPRNFETGFHLGWDDAIYHSQGSGYWGGFSQYVIVSVNGVTYSKQIAGEMFYWYPGGQNQANTNIIGIYVPGCELAIANNNEPEYNEGKKAGALAYWSYLNGWHPIE